ncbi:hypothetical protein FNF27_03728 [Cafeteria roenbergensis]|uniref:Uncharacterized protein n=2 Tax=Cafeteria roenbergensis TaxID=33653 RepID=A0A5A8DQ51_CAFRO|nr:hypothetical protein FNF29_04078 [Cafeteria roenbergensis]KAA0166031.1 hypothetical protein FNF31_01644 [Cafeteria roenbergensis]KAA0174833.1 hypothetical protein FNF27_03728 [Cafeteria roenbergensis]|eukprot:KAA0152214.1 hypothetical protein FNF29_04078 [Cafeteria roenbergensis]
MDWKRISEGHERLKRRIHSARMPLPRWAIPIAKLVYFSIPVAFGVWLMMWTFEQMDKNAGTLETKALAKLESSAKAETATPIDRQRLDALRERIRIASERQTAAAPGDERA